MRVSSRPFVIHRPPRHRCGRREKRHEDPMDYTDWPDTPFTLAEATSRGIPRHRVYDAVRDGELRRVLRGVHVRRGLALDTLGRAHAAALVVSRHAVLCDRTAAWLHGVDARKYAGLDVEPPLECFVFRGHDPMSRAECRGGVRDLVREDWEWIGRVRVTTPLRTAVDLACLLSRREAIAAVDALMREHALTREDLHRLVRRYRRRRGVVQARQIVAVADPRSESAGESWTRLEMLDRGLPEPELQYWVKVDGVPTYRIDLAYPHARVAIEYDGAEHHSSADDRRRDARRRAHLRRLGWTIIVVTKHSFTDEAALTWTREVKRALGV